MESVNDKEHGLRHSAGSGRLHLVHWVVMSLSLVLVFAVWYSSKKNLREKAAIEFNQEAHRVIELVSERMRKYEDGLWGGVSAIQANGGAVSYQEWATFAKNLRIESKYPGINGIGVIHHIPPEKRDSYLAAQRIDRPNYRIHPNHDEDEYWPITYIEPVAPNAKAVGLDMAHEVNRYTAAKLARDTGVAHITGPIILVQDKKQTPGFLLYAPFYKRPAQNTVRGRRENIIGLVYAPFVVSKLVAGTLDKTKRHVGIRIMDGDVVLYDEHDTADPNHEAEPLFHANYPLELYGRNWKFDIRSKKSFRAATAGSEPLIILLGGLFINLLLFLLFISLSRANSRAVSFANQVTRELQDKTKDLERSNLELETFAYVASHDLKTPLRGIGDLAEYLEEDLEEYLDSPDANPSVRKNLNRLNGQVRRMDNLIKGILSYSSVGSGDNGQIEEINVADVVSEIREDLGLAERCAIEGDLPTLAANGTQLSQVLANLIGNAIKYHDDPDNALIRVSATRNNGMHLLSVADNGPGIDPRFHSRIFEVFQTLQSKDEIESTGIGLSIVKKIVEGQGGDITVSSQPGQGARFTFSWPASAPPPQNEKTGGPRRRSG